MSTDSPWDPGALGHNRGDGCSRTRSFAPGIDVLFGALRLYGPDFEAARLAFKRYVK
jgi:hypothetical protein